MGWKILNFNKPIGRLKKIVIGLGLYLKEIIEDVNNLMLNVLCF